MTRTAQWTRSEPGSDTEYLQLVRVTRAGEVQTYPCEDLDGAEHPYAVQVTTGDRIRSTSDGPGDFVGLYDLDGDQIPPWGLEWEIVEGDDLAAVPADVIEQIERGWECGLSTVEAA